MSNDTATDYSGLAAQALAEIERMASVATDDTAFVIFPEGRLFHPKVRDRLMARVEEVDSARAERLSALTGMLPPKAGGFQALLATVPDADVVIIGHRGLDRFKKLADLIEVVPVREPIRVTARRITRTDIPVDPEDQARWLDETWLQLDAELAQPAG
jgi:1-acyl-sn-glycerol-3-phosphate acyltransferase